jgi:dTDP-4-amino-4,6-dideoxygalactose transaminase
MIKFHSERNIRYSEILKIMLRKKDLKDSLKKIFPKREITLTNYGRTAFQLIIDQHNLKNCKVMVPAFICPVFFDIFKKNKITPIFIDVEKDTFNISPKTLKQNFDKSAKALITNNMNGLPCDIEGIKNILHKKQILIEDCAHSFGAYRKGVPIGTYGDSSFFSLYKNLPSISGGFAITKSQLKKLEKEKIKIKDLLYFVYYLGKNANIIKCFKRNKSIYNSEFYFEKVNDLSPNNLTCKLAGFYTNKIKEIIKSRQEVARIIRNKLKDTELTLQADPNNEHIYTYFSFLLPKRIENKRNDFLKELEKISVIGRLIWDKPLSKYFGKKLNNAEEISKRIVGIPINPNYSKKDAENLAKKVVFVLKKFS